MPSHRRVDRTVRYEWLLQYLWRDFDEVRVDALREFVSHMLSLKAKIVAEIVENNEAISQT